VAHIYLQFPASWNLVLSGDGSDILTESEIASLKDTTFATIKKAFEGYAVDFTEGVAPTRDPLKTCHQINIVDQFGNGHTGETTVGTLVSTVYLPTILLDMKDSIYCGNFMSCRGTPFSEIPETTGSRVELLRAFGQGLGATSAHEVGHQRWDDFQHEFSWDVQDCMGCYDYGPPPTRVYFFEPLRWSVAAQGSMLELVPRWPR
jgi:hypothetical protein